MGALPAPDIDFALLLKRIGPSRELGRNRDPRRDPSLRLTLMHPALVVGIKGPVMWTKSLAHHTPEKRPMNLQAAIKNLAAAVLPSLKTHLLNWQLRCEQMHRVSDRQLPAWFMVFGVIYDAESIVIVAHIPFIDAQKETTTRQSVGFGPQFSYLSCVINSIPFAPAFVKAPLSKPWCLDRFRAGFALFSLQQHAFRLASLWETVVWPSEIILAEDDFEREYRCPSPTPSERIIPDPFDGLFEECPLTSLEQQLELDEEIQERDARAQHILPALLQWIHNVADCTNQP